MIGQSISHYKILEKLGEGGMGVVYKAQDTTLDRLVALKFLPQHVSASDQDKARFIQEAKAAAALNHPNICTIYGVEEHENQMFIEMEFVEGQTLHDKGMTRPMKQAIEIGIQLADGLAAAHEKGIVHRDIKPENIMIQKDGRVRIMDFGLAKLKSASRLTKAGSTVGTTGYMSPEQVQGMESDHRSDIFSLGVILYELFSGQSPFKGVHETAINYEIVNVDPDPISSVKPDIAPDLDSIVLECLEKDTSERAQSAKQVAIDLKRFKRESSRSRVSRISSVRPPTMSGQSIGPVRIEIPAWKNLVWPMGAAVSTIAFVVTLWSPWKQETLAHVVTRAVVALPKDQLLNTTSYVAVAISPDGTLLVYKANGKLHLRNMNSFDSTPIPGTEEGSGPFFSPDGKWIGFFSGGMLKKVPVSGGASTVITTAPDNRGGTWGKGGDIVLAPQWGSGLMIVREGGGVARVLTRVDSMKNERTHRWPFFLPDGKTVIYTVGTIDSPDFYEDAVIEAVDIETGARKVLMKGGCSAHYSSAGFLVYWRSSSLFAVSFDPKKLEIIGTSFPILDNVNGDPATGMAGYTFSQNGTVAYIPGNSGLANQSLVKKDLHGVTTPFEAPLQSYLEPRISPDGNRIATAIQNGKESDIWVYEISRKTLSKLTFGGLNRTPAWSPDGKRIAYYAYDGGKQSLVIRQADGSGEPEIFSSGFGRAYIDDWSKDGSIMILDIASQTRKGTSATLGNSDLFVMSLSGDHTPKPFLESQFDEWQASLSSDGKWIAYSSNESGTYQVYIRQFPQGGGRWSVSSEEAYGSQWAPDGKTLYFYSPGKLMSVPIQTVPSLIVGKPQVLFSGYQQKSSDSGLMFDVSPDGKWFVATQSKDDESNYRQIHLVLNWFDEIQARMQSSK